MRRTYLTVFIAVLLLIGLTACSSPKVTQQPTAAPAVTTPAATETETPALTPVPTTPPDITPTQAPTPTATQTPEPTEDNGKVEIADGFYYIKLTDKIKDRITGMSYPEDDKDCQVQYDDLRYIKIKHYDFDGNVCEGELIVNKKVAEDVTNIFYELYKQKYAMTSIKLVDNYGEPADDTKSMEANNTSAFCYRRVTGSKNMSHHSFGSAIDINPQLNPYMDGDRVAPENGAEYADRSKDFRGKIDHSDAAYKIFKKYGWLWGGDWNGDKDYQHFYKDLGYNRKKP